MKKLLLLALVMLGGVVNVSADTKTDLRLVSNVSSPAWDLSDPSGTYQFDYHYDSTGAQEVYEYTVTSSMIGDKDLYFNLNFWDEWGRLQPNQDSNKEFSFTNGQWDNSETRSGSTNAFVVKHTTIKASSYKITVYRKTGEGAGAWVKVEIVDMPVTIGSTGKATFCCNRALDFTGTGVSAYTITGSTKATGALTVASKTTVPANTGLYLEASAGTYYIPVIETASAAAVGKNMLVGVTENTAIGQNVTISSTEYTNYILTVNRAVGEDVDTPKFFKVNSEGNTVTANKAYLQIPTADASRESFWFDGDVTAIEAAKMEQKMEGEVFNLAGQRVAQPTKGLYIVNGKKVIKK